jgi:hypothetical protein
MDPVTAQLIITLSVIIPSSIYNQKCRKGKEGKEGSLSFRLIERSQKKHRHDKKYHFGRDEVKQNAGRKFT